MDESAKAHAEQEDRFPKRPPTMVRPTSPLGYLALPLWSDQERSQ
jgi:hypothetical protein